MLGASFVETVTARRGIVLKSDSSKGSGLEVERARSSSAIHPRRRPPVRHPITNSKPTEGTHSPYGFPRDCPDCLVHRGERVQAQHLAADALRDDPAEVQPQVH